MKKANEKVFQVLMASVMATLIMLFSAAVPVSAEKYSKNTDFMVGKYGIFLHYLPQMQGAGGTLKGWNDCVNKFDTTAFAKSVKEVGASWVCLTLSQNDGWYSIPMPELETMIGGTKVSTDRDLVMDLSNALEPLGIKLMLYWTPGVPSGNKAQAKAMGAERQVGGNLAGGQNNSDYMLNWTIVKNKTAIMRAVSGRYGERISGWWIDGCYDSIQFNERVAAEESAALKSGNKNAVVAFNNGTKYFDCRFEGEDYSAGETGHPNSLDKETLLNHTAAGRWTENGFQTHYLTFLGKNWGGSGTVLNTDELVKHSYENILKKGGALTLDVGVSNAGVIDAQQYAQLKALGSYIASQPEITMQNIIDNKSTKVSDTKDEPNKDSEPKNTDSKKTDSTPVAKTANKTMLILFIAELAVFAATATFFVFWIVRKKKMKL